MAKAIIITAIGIAHAAVTYQRSFILDGAHRGKYGLHHRCRQPVLFFGQQLPASPIPPKPAQLGTEAKIIAVAQHESFSIPEISQRESRGRPIDVR
jgi:hypothetical protein